MSDRPQGSQGRRLGQQGREEISAMSPEELQALADEHGVATVDDAGNQVNREELVNNLANKVRQADRQAAGAETPDDTDTEGPADTNV
jgi:hypothetical protein